MAAGDKVLLAHGSGGRAMHRLIKEFFVDNFDNPVLARLGDSAIVGAGAKALAFTTDSYVVSPLFFPGGDIGKLAICGTVNDLCVVGAKPLYISCGFVIEEGLDFADLNAVVESMKAATKSAGVKVVAGDTKVVQRGKVDRIFINTSGIGAIGSGVKLGRDNIRPSDKLIINGNIGEHEIAVLSAREDFGFSSKIKSDCAPLNGLISRLLRSGCGIKFMRDPTRGGLASTLNEIVEGRDYGIELSEGDIPVSAGVRAACELLGYEALYLANEGKVVVVVRDKDAGKALKVMRRHPLGRDAKIIGEAVKSPEGKVLMKTATGGRRFIDMLSGEQLPRIC